MGIAEIRNPSVKGGEMTDDRAGVVLGETMWRYR